ncbi:hypothetical protein PTTW11_05314 [Pyrenophora teres f. teres]|uniref:Uncharacterized protein n=1 Tax=Pyrenophora teres f. teres TaxID=97479 RepID=A0A6S6W2U3_9PLEO|nr:hypothetical protein PTTW11_05314 [Pyrenophora teres f. teres]
MPVPSNSERSSVIFSAQDAEGTPNPLNTPFSEVSFSQLVSDSAHSYMDFDLSHEAITNSNQAEITDQQTSSFQNQMLYFSPSADMLMLDWLSPTCDQTLSKNGAAKFYDFVGIEHDGCANKCTISLFSERIVPDTTTAKTKPSSAHQTHRITALFQNVDGGSRRQQTVLDKVKVLLSSEHETCLSNFLRKVDSGGEHSSLVLTELPVTKLLQNAFKELGGLGLFINEEDVTRIQQRFFDSEHLPMDASDASLLVVSLAWGALLEPEMSSSSRVALLDAVLETSTLLLRQHHSVRKFLLSISERTGSKNLPALILTSISTAASLNLHLEPVLRKLCASDEQVIHTQRAMWLLYCIDKSHALRCHSFSLVSDSFLPTTSPPGNTLKSDSAATPSLELLSVRSQFSKICSDILQLREGANEKSSEDCSTRAVTLSTALEEWYRSTKISQMMLSLDHHDVMRVKLQISYYYYEAQFQLLSTGLAYPSTSSLAKSQELRQLLNQSTREIITCSSTMSSEYLLQDLYVFHNT